MYIYKGLSIDHTPPRYPESDGSLPHVLPANVGTLGSHSKGQSWCVDLEGGP